MVTYRAPFRFRRKRLAVIASLFTLFAVYHLFLSSPTELPEELLDSPLFHGTDPRQAAETTTLAATSREGRWQRARALAERKISGSAVQEEIGLAYDEDGLVRGWSAAHDLLQGGGLGKREKRRLKEIRDTHPIEELMARGKAKWESLLAR